MCGVETWNMNINSNLSLVENFIRDVQNGRDEFHLSFHMNQVHGLLELRWHFIRCLFETFNQTGAILFIVYSPFLKYLFVFRIVKWKTFCFLTFFLLKSHHHLFRSIMRKKNSSNLFEKKKYLRNWPNSFILIVNKNVTFLMWNVSAMICAFNVSLLINLFKNDIKSRRYLIEQKRI